MFGIRAFPFTASLLLGLGLNVLPASADMAPTAPQPMITTCDEFQAWFANEPIHYATAQTLSNYGHFPSVIHHAHEGLSLNGDASHALGPLAADNQLMMQTHSQIGGGGCLSGLYDKVHHIVALRNMYDSSSDWIIFHPHIRPAGLPNANLAHARTLHGAHLRMTLQQLLALEGPGRKKHVGKLLFIRYSVNDNAKTGAAPTGWITFMLEHNRVTAIDYFWG